MTNDKASGDLVERLDDIMMNGLTMRNFNSLEKAKSEFLSLRAQLAAAEARAEDYGRGLSNMANTLVAAEAQLQTAKKALEEIVIDDQFTQALDGGGWTTFDGPSAKIAREALRSLKPDGSGNG